MVGLGTNFRVAYRVYIYHSASTSAFASAYNHQGKPAEGKPEATQEGVVQVDTTRIITFLEVYYSGADDCSRQSKIVAKY
jgi:hypothetical protein